MLFSGTADPITPPAWGDAAARALSRSVHVRATGEIGLFKILSQGGVAAGVRRIEAVTGPGAYQHVKREEEVLAESAARLKGRARPGTPR